MGFPPIEKVGVVFHVLEFLSTQKKYEGNIVTYKCMHTKAIVFFIM